MTRLRTLVFRFYERPALRNWSYTLAFAIFVPVGYRFATLAWRYGSWFDKPLAVIAGVFIGMTTLVTLMRVWHVPPRKTLTAPPPPTPPVEHSMVSLANELLAESRRRAAVNRAMASRASALGSTTGKIRYR